MKEQRDLKHWLIVILVFSVTGSLSVLVSRLVLREILGLEGSLTAGPWSFRIVYLLLIPPTYSMMLVAIGTVAGKRDYFLPFALRIWGRFLPARFRAKGR